MSSHHIVREKQEPALLVLGLADFSFEHLGQLLEWSPTVIATSQTFAQLQADNIKIDLLIADQMPEVVQSDIKLVATNGENEITAALSYLTSKGYPAVNIIVSGTNVDLSQFFKYTNYINIVTYTSKEKIYPVQPGFSKWKAAGERIRLLSAGSGFEQSGLKQVGDNSFETIADGFFTFRFDDAYLWVAESL